MRFLRVLIVVALLAVGVGAVFVVMGGLPSANGGSASEYITAAASQRDVTQSAVASGSVAASTTYDLTFGTPAAPAGSSSASNNGSGAGSTTWPVKSVAVKVGDVVKKGAVLAVADPTNANLQLVIAQANLTAAQSKLDTDLAAPSSETKAAASDSLHQAELQLTQAKQSASNTRRQNSISVSQASKAISDAKKKLADDQAASASAQVIAADKAAVSQAQDNYSATRARVAASNDQAANQVSSAQLGLTSAKHTYSTRIAKSTAAQVASDRASVATAQSSVADAQAAVDNATLVAPIDGRISVVNIVAGSSAPSGTAVELQSSAMSITAAFSERDVPNLKVGQAATVTIKAVSTDAVSGTVSSIAESASGSGGVVSFNVTVALATPPTAVRAGMSAEVSVTIAQSANVLAVPAAAIQGSNGSYAVRVVDATGAARTVDVQVGLVTSSYVEITNGLTAGEQVVIGTSTSRTGSTTNGGGLFGGGAIPGGGGGGRFNGGGAPNGGGTTP